MNHKNLLLGSAIVLAAAFYVTGANAQSTTTQTTSSTTTYNRTTTAETYNRSNGFFGPLSGLYVGGFAGYGWTDAEATGLPTYDVNGGDYGVFAGYQVDTLLNNTVNRLGLGLNGSIEGFYSWSDADDDKTIAGVGTEIEKEHEWGVSFRPGLTLVDKYTPFGLKPYGIIGYRKLELKGSVDGVGSDKTTHDGFELGLGTEIYAYQDIGVRLDYSHTFYKEKDDIDPSSDDLRLGVAFHF